MQLQETLGNLGTDVRDGRKPMEAVTKAVSYTIWWKWTDSISVNVLNIFRIYCMKNKRNGNKILLHGCYMVLQLTGKQGLCLTGFFSGKVFVQVGFVHRGYV